MAAADDRSGFGPMRIEHVTAGLLTRLEAERSQIAQSLHDRSCQSLSACLLMLETSETAPDDEARLDLIAELRDALEQVSTLSRRLRPPSLADGDLLTPLQSWLSQLKVSFDFDAPVHYAAARPALDERVGLLAFRLIQDAVEALVSIQPLPRFSIVVDHPGNRTRVQLTAPPQPGADRIDWTDILVPGFFGLTQALAGMGANCRVWRDDDALRMVMDLPGAERARPDSP